jgi:hypothetical protein
MDQRSICAFFAIKELSAQIIHNELANVLDLDAIAYLTVIKYRVFNKSLSFDSLMIMRQNQIDQIVLAVKIVLVMFSDPLVSFDPVIKCPIFLVTPINRSLMQPNR